MLFKLTLLLVGLIFVTMFLAGSPDTKKTAATTTPLVTSEPETAPAPARVEEVPTVPTAPVAQEEAAPLTPTPEPVPLAEPLPESDPAPLQSEITRADPEADQDAPLLLPGLGISGLSLDDNAAAVSLADGVRARLAESNAQPLRRPDVSSVEGAAAVTESSEPDEDALPLGQVTATSVNLRAGPSTAEAIVGRASQGDMVEVLGDAAPGWSTIRDPASGDTVYMSSQFLLMQQN